MKTISIFATIMLTAFFAFGQQNIPEIKVTPPQFAGIKNAMKFQGNPQNASINDYLTKNINFPICAEISGFEGTEVIQFTVTKEGNITDFKIINGVCHEINDEVITVLKQTNGMWFPGYNNGEPVEMTKEISVAFCQNISPSKSVAEKFTAKAKNCYTSGNKSLLKKQNPKKAAKFYSYGLNYLPYDHSLLLMRGMCRYELGDKEGANEDWNRLISFNDDIDKSEYITKIEGMKGYDELMAILKK